MSCARALGVVPGWVPCVPFPQVCFRVAADSHHLPLSLCAITSPLCRAKGFGSLLDLNCAIIVLPVSRTLLRLLYNRSTADQGLVSRTLRAVLEYVPLDQNITFHKIIAWVILIAACGHM